MMVKRCISELLGVMQGCFLQPTYWSLADSYIIKLGHLVSFRNSTFFTHCIAHVPCGSSGQLCIRVYAALFWQT